MKRLIKAMENLASTLEARNDLKNVPVMPVGSEKISKADATARTNLFTQVAQLEVAIKTISKEFEPVKNAIVIAKGYIAEAKGKLNRQENDSQLTIYDFIEAQ